MAEKTDLRVNGRRVQVENDPDCPLLWVLREDLDLTGAKYGCGEGQCGACTVLLDGIATRSCITAVASVRGREITTIEGLEKDGKLHPVQEAFLEVGAMQCGYCTCGMIMSCSLLLTTWIRSPHLGGKDGNCENPGAWSGISRSYLTPSSS